LGCYHCPESVHLGGDNPVRPPGDALTAWHSRQDGP
jgi:hypothetical protein